MKNKIMMSLVVSSISAMGIAPELASANQSVDNFKNLVQSEVNADNQAQIDALLSKKVVREELSANFDSILSNFGNNGVVLKEKIANEFKLAALSSDSTSINSLGNTNAGTQQMSCHTACHGACHSACHGSRGWR